MIKNRFFYIFVIVIAVLAFCINNNPYLNAVIIFFLFAFYAIVCGIIINSPNKSEENTIKFLSNLFAD